MTSPKTNDENTTTEHPRSKTEVFTSTMEGSDHLVSETTGLPHEPDSRSLSNHHGTDLSAHVAESNQDRVAMTNFQSSPDE